MTLYALRAAISAVVTALLLAPSAAGATADVTIETFPKKLFVEHDGAETTVAFHVVIRNRGDASVTIDRLVETILVDDEPRTTELEGDALTKAVRGGKTTIPPRGAIALLGRVYRSPEQTTRITTVRLEAGGARLELPVHEYRQRGAYQLPFHGEWLIGVGHEPGSTHHRMAGDSQSFAWDILRLGDDGRLMKPTEGGPTRKEDSRSWGLPIVAAGAGTVVRAVDGRPDIEPTMIPPFATTPPEDLTEILGNFVVIDHGDGEHSLYAHLRKGSVEVAAGDAVRGGQPVGRCGNSGNTTQPHLHFQFQDGPDFFGSNPLPIRIDDWERRRAPDAAPDRVGRGTPKTGDRVRRAPW